MRQYSLFSGFSSLEFLESKLSPTSFSVGAVAAAAVSPLDPQDDGHDHSFPAHVPLLDSEPTPVPDPGDNPPVVYPILPSSGPNGPGS